MTGGDGSDALEGGSGTDTALFEHDINEYTINLGPNATYAVSRNGETDFVHNFENFSFNGVVVDVAGNPGGLFNTQDPVFQSGTSGTVDENVVPSTVVYDANATDADAAFGGIAYSLSGGDSGLVSIDAVTGEVRLLNSPNFEVKSTYSFDVTATQGSTHTTQTVTLGINDLNDNAPVFQSGTTASVNENVAPSTVVYDANATDADSNVTFGSIAYTLSGGDSALFSIDAATGEVRLLNSPNFEVKPSYSFDVTATQGSTHSTRTVTLGINDLNDNSPVFQSGTSASIAESSAASTVVYDANATDADTSFGNIVYSLTGADAGLLNINGATGEVRLNTAADFEAKNQYLFSVLATQGATATSQAVTLSITNVNDGPGNGGFETQFPPAVEAGLTRASLGGVALVDPEGDTLTYKVSTLPTHGTVFLNNVAVAANQVLTQAQFLELKYESPETAGFEGVQFDVSDGVNHTTLNLNLTVTAGANRVHNGTAAGGDRLDGGAGNDTINGMGGADLMIGGSGNDTFYVDNGSDRVNDTSGIDTISSSVTYSLTDAVRVVGTIENLTLTGSAALGIGNGANNVLKGNGVANELRGMAGNDTLNGNTGNDILKGGAGNDIFVFNTTPSATNRDIIADFSNVAGNNDTIHLDNAIFAKLGGTGGLNAAFFKIGAAATDANDYIVYNHTTGALYYDIDGNGGHSAIQFATLSTRPTISAGDFVVI